MIERLSGSQSVKDQLGLHVAYFFDNTESPNYVAG